MNQASRREIFGQPPLEGDCNCTIIALSAQRRLVLRQPLPGMAQTMWRTFSASQIRKSHERLPRAALVA